MEGVTWVTVLQAGLTWLFLFLAGRARKSETGAVKAEVVTTSEITHTKIDGQAQALDTQGYQMAIVLQRLNDMEAAETSNHATISAKLDAMDAHDSRRDLVLKAMATRLGAQWTEENQKVK